MFAEALPIGMVLNYGLGLMMSMTLTIYTNIMKTWLKPIKGRRCAQTEGFKYTTLQLNRNYAVKLRVGGNDHCTRGGGHEGRARRAAAPTPRHLLR